MTEIVAPFKKTCNDRTSYCCYCYVVDGIQVVTDGRSLRWSCRFCASFLYLALTRKDKQVVQLEETRERLAS